MALQFPSDLLQKREYVCEISALQPVYTTGDEDLARDLSEFNIPSFDNRRGRHGVELNRRVISTVYLPIPINLTQGPQEHTIDTQANLLGALGSTIQDSLQLINGKLAAVNRSLNIGHYVVYQAPNFKLVEYNWTMMPRNERESRDLEMLVHWLGFFSSPSAVGQNTEVDNVLGTATSGTTDGVEGAYNSIREHFDEHGLGMGVWHAPGALTMAAINAAGALTFEYPNEFRIRYLRIKDGRYQYIYVPPPKTGFISKLEVNYFDEEGNPTTFFRGSHNPVATNIKFTMQENELTFKSDYANIQRAITASLAVDSGELVEFEAGQ